MLMGQIASIVIVSGARRPMETSNAQFWMIRRHDLSLKAIGDVSSRIASNMAQGLVKPSPPLQNTVVWRPNSMMRTHKIVL
jgi:hypothetical protein